MSVAFALVMLFQASDQPMLEEYKAKTTAKIACKVTENPDEITVCALRDADKKYRVPFVTTRAIDNVPFQKERALEDVMFQCGVSGPFLTQCGGMFGVTVGVGFDGKVIRKRELAP